MEGIVVGWGWGQTGQRMQFHIKKAAEISLIRNLQEIREQPGYVSEGKSDLWRKTASAKALGLYCTWWVLRTGRGPMWLQWGEGGDES